MKPLSLSFEEIKEMMCMKRMVFSLSFLLFVSGMYAQITLEECQRKTQENYPLVHQYGLVEKTKEYNLENAAKGYLPQFALSAKASYQSEVTEIPVKLPGVDLKGLPKDQYQVMLELQQKIWDGGGIRTQKKQTTAEAEIEKEKLNVDMYALNSRVNDLYFGILLLDEQLKQNALLQDELERNYRQITAYVENGIANQADLDAVKVEQLNTKQKRVELVSSRMAYLKMLSLLVGEKLSQETVLEKPVPQDEISAGFWEYRDQLKELNELTLNNKLHAILDSALNKIQNGIDNHDLSECFEAHKIVHDLDYWIVNYPIGSFYAAPVDWGGLDCYYGLIANYNL